MKRRRPWTGLAAWILLAGAAGGRAGMITDDMGRTVAVPERPARIVSISPSVTEILFAIGAGDRVKGVTQYCTYPPAALTLTKIGGSMTPNVEKIVALKPDLVIGDTATTISKARVDLLTRAGIATLILDMRSWKDILERIRNMGRWCGAADGAEREAASMVRRVEAVQRAVKGRPRPSVLFVVWNDPLYTVGRPTYIQDAIALAGGRNIAEDIEKPTTTFSFEEVVKRRPEVIALAFHDASPKNFPPVWKTLPAVKKWRVLTLSPDLMVHASPRLVDGIEELAKLLHPDAFPPSR